MKFGLSRRRVFTKSAFFLLTLLGTVLTVTPLLAAQAHFGYHGATGEVTWRGTQAL